MLDALAKMPSPTFWTSLYLLATIFLALGTMLTINLVVTTACKETFPSISLKIWRCPLIASLLGFSMGLFYTCNGFGVHLFSLVDYNLAQ